MCTSMIAHLCVDFYIQCMYLYDSSPVCRLPQCFQSDVFSVHYILLCQLQHQCVPGYIQFSPFRIAFSSMLHSIFQFENISMYNSKSFSLKIFRVTLIKIHQCKGEKNWYFLTMIFSFQSDGPYIQRVLHTYILQYCTVDFISASFLFSLKYGH